MFLEMALAHGLKVQRVNLHDSQLNGSHGLVEVTYAGRPGIVDPQYNHLYRGQDGRPATLMELRSNPSLYRANAANCQNIERVDGREPVRTAYPIDVDGYGFERAAYINYGYFGFLRKGVWEFLERRYGDEGTLFPRHPTWAMYPAYRLAALLNSSIVLFALIWIMLSRLKRRLTRRRLSSFSNGN